MLNTQSRLGAALIWLATLAIVAKAGWTLFALGHPLDILDTLSNSGFAAMIARNQIAFAGLLGFGALAFAHMFNGWRDRAERRHAIERAEHRFADVLSREAGQLAAQFERATAGDGTTQARNGLRDQADNLLLSAPMTEIARLGAGAAAVVQALRSSVRRLSADQRDDQSDRSRLPTPLLEATFAARNAHRVLATLTEKGQAAADRLRLMPPSEDDVARLTRSIAETPQTTRLLPAA